jgi:hypothetical protein
VFFSKLKARVERWRWLTDNFNVIESGRRKNAYVAGRLEVQINDDHIEFPRKIRAWSQALAERELRGPEHHRLGDGRGLRVPVGDQARERRKIHSTLSTSASRASSGGTSA